MSKATGLTHLPAKLAILLVFTLFGVVAQASILGNGNSVPPTPLFPGGTQVATTSGTITTATFSASYQQWVYSDPNNSWCAGCLDFVYQFTDNGPDVLERFSMYNFAGVQVDVGTNPFGIHDPTLIDRSMNGPVIGFNFPASDEINVGETTVLLVIETDAHTFTNGFVSAQDGTAGFGFAYAPSAVPEPSSLALLGGGLTFVAAMLRKQRFGKRL
jgi:hypothetical protein